MRLLMRNRITGELPAVRFPMPCSPADIAKSRSAGTHFEDFEKQVAAISSGFVDSPSSPDGLIYAHGVLGKLAKLSDQIANRAELPRSATPISGFAA